MPTKTELLNNLFNEWKEKYKDSPFVKDGIIDESTWSNSDVKVLFLLKEANAKSPESKKDLLNEHDVCSPSCYLDLRNLLYNYYYVKTPKRAWPIVGKLCWCCHKLKSNLLQIPFWEEAENWLIKAAIMNIKKTPGKEKSIYEEIKDVAHKDKLNIICEILIINPDIIICGGTWDYFFEDILSYKKQEIPFGPVIGIKIKELVKIIPKEDRSKIELPISAIDEEKIIDIIRFLHPSMPGVYHFIQLSAFSVIYSNYLTNKNKDGITAERS